MAQSRLSNRVAPAPKHGRVEDKVAVGAARASGTLQGSLALRPDCMGFPWLLVVRAVHILGAILWVGATFALGAVIFPALDRTPGAKDAFVMAVLRRGGFGPFFTVVGVVP